MCIRDRRLYDINAKWSEQWEVIVDQKEPLPGADDVNPSKGYTEDKTKLLDAYD